MNRRTFLARSGAAAVLSACADPTIPLPTPAGGAWMGGQFLGLAPYDVPPTRAFGTLTDGGWDARLLLDLSTLQSDGLTTPNNTFYVRTEYPDLLTTLDADWQVQVTGLAAPTSIDLSVLEDLAVDQGEVLLECSGNGPTAKFGLMSSADWQGVRLDDLLDQLAIDVASTAWGIEVVGFDEHSVPSEGGHSTPGASWILPLELLTRSGAFLATGMNGAPLPPHHGAPVRLVVPNWYGCTCIKWVTELRFVAADEPTTSQMLEFASRTEQPDPPAQLAADFLEPAIDHAATVVRVERWDVEGTVRFRVIGLAWGGDEPAGALTVMAAGQAWQADVQPDREQRTWGLFEHALPEGIRGTTTFSTSIANVRTRRLDRGYYDMAFDLQT